MRAVVLAAGEGIRMRPLTNSMSKMLLPIAGKSLLEHVLLALKEAGVVSVILVVGYRREEIVDYFGNGMELGMQLSYVWQQKQMGTAHALSCVNLKESFVMVNGDVLFDSPSLRAMIEKHKSTGAAATLGAYRVEDITPYGALVVEGKKVLKISEKSKKKESGLANAGVYIFSPVIFEAVARTKPSPRGELEVTASIQKLIDQGRFVQFHELKWWQHVGVPWDILNANEHFLKTQAANMKGIVEDGAHVASNVSVGDGTRIKAGAYIEGPSRIGKNCDIGPNCYIRPFTSVGDKVRIGNGVEVKNSIIMDETHIGHLSYIGDSIVGRRCNFGAGTKVGNLRLDEKNVKVMVRGKLVDTGRRKFGAIIADNVKTGLNSVINPGISLGPNSALGPGVVLYKDLPPNKCILIEQQLKETSCR
jgi:bifunctional UDP-N-acetylglucosamine pyrophosphorylase/glucosamine-1-phosphate N-acetyltransferase